MILRSEIIPVLQAWYDYKMDPEKPELHRTHHSTLDLLCQRLSLESHQQITRCELKVALRKSFQVWMKDQKHPPPKKPN